MAELNLDQLQPEPHGVVFRGTRYSIPANIPVSTIISAIVLEENATIGSRLEEDADTRVSEAAAKLSDAELRVALAETDEALEKAEKEARACRAAIRLAEDEKLRARDRVKEAAEDMYQIVWELLADANPDLPEAGYRDYHREAFVEAVKPLLSSYTVDIRPGDVTDEMLKQAGVEQEPGLRLSFEDCTMILGMIQTGRAVTLTDAVAETTAVPEGIPDDPPTVEEPEKTPAPKTRAAARRTQSGKRSRSASSG